MGVGGLGLEFRGGAYFGARYRASESASCARAGSLGVEALLSQRGFGTQQPPQLFCPDKFARIVC